MRTRLTRTLWYKRSSVVRALRKSSLVPSAPNAQVRVHLQVAGPGAVRVSLKLHASDGKQGRQASKEKASSPQPETSYEALLVAISIVVGVLAVVMTRNPKAAAKAAAGAVATVKALCTFA